jgi:hypothetical protein
MLFGGQLSAVLALVLAGSVLLVPISGVSQGVSGALAACIIRLREAYAAPGGALTEAIGAGLAAGVAIWLAYAAVSTGITEVLGRRRHRRVLQVTGTGDARGLVVLPDRRPVVYCVGGGRNGVVVATSAALHTLSDEQLQAVLAHERAHLRGRHGLLVAVSRVMDRVLAPLRFAPAEPHTRQLIELIADDRAGERHDPVTLAESMVVLAEASLATPALAMGGGPERVARLLEPGSLWDRRRQAYVGLAAIGLVLLPALLAVAPAIVVKVMGPLPGHLAATASLLH